MESRQHTVSQLWWNSNYYLVAVWRADSTQSLSCDGIVTTTSCVESRQHTVSQLWWNSNYYLVAVWRADSTQSLSCDGYRHEDTGWCGYVANTICDCIQRVWNGYLNKKKFCLEMIQQLEGRKQRYGPYSTEKNTSFLEILQKNGSVIFPYAFSELVMKFFQYF